MFLPCRPCCTGGGIVLIDGCVYTGDPPDSVELDISFIKSDTSTSGISGINLSSGTTATTAYSTIVLGKQNADDASPTDYASTACYAILDNLSGSFSLTRSTVSGGYDYTYTDPSGFEFLLELRSYATGFSQAKLIVNAGPEVRMLQTYNATPPTQAAMASSTWNSGASLCYSPSFTLGGVDKWYLAGGVDEYRRRGPTFNLPFPSTCDDTTGSWPTFYAEQDCESGTGATSLSVYSSHYAAWQSVTNITTVDGPDSQPAGLTSPVEFDVATYVSWPDYSTTLATHQFTYLGVKYPYFQTVGSQVRIYFYNSPTYKPLLTTSAPVNAVASRYSLDSIVGVYGTEEVALFKRA